MVQNTHACIAGDHAHVGRRRYYSALVAGEGPTLVIAPSRSPLTSLTDQITVRNSIPDARMAVVEGPGHEIYVDEPEQCISALLRFLRSL
jgi:pimeloyl-ACP methyl ester carboxylesterase